MNKDSVTVYWAPMFFNVGEVNSELKMNWNIVYPDPITLYDDLRSNMADVSPNQSLFHCPAFKGFSTNVFLFKNPMKADFEIDENLNVKSNLRDCIGLNIDHPEISLKNQLMITYGLRWIFFAEEDDIDITMSSPFFNTPNHMQYGSIVPGKFCISNWFRPINLEFTLKPGIRNMKIERDEPILSVYFNTNKKINFVRFQMNDKLFTVSNTCKRSTEWESWVPLANRYKRFKESRTKQIVLKEIKNNLIQ